MTFVMGAMGGGGTSPDNRRLQQDGATCHWALETWTYRWRSSIDALIQWPLCSCDLTP